MSAEEDVLKCALCSSALQEPVLLQCLHNVCRSCMSSAPAARVSCPTCRVTTDVSCAPTNLILSSKAEKQKVLSDVYTCAKCKEKGKMDEEAITWCFTCQLSLCADCQQFHGSGPDHRVLSLDGRINLSELYRETVPPCTNHFDERNKQEFACFTCKNGCCSKCAHKCYEYRHDIYPLDNTCALELVSDSKQQATTLLFELNSAITLIEAHLSLPKDVESARKNSITQLKKAKKIVLDSISTAYQKAEESLYECWDSLVEKSQDLKETADVLKTTIQWADKYCKLALDTNDVARLFPQLDTVLSRLKILQQEARQLKKPADPEMLVKLNICLPGDLDSITGCWVGMARVVTDDFCCSVSSIPAEDCDDYYTKKVATLKELESLTEKQKEQCERLTRQLQTFRKRQSELKEVKEFVSDSRELKQLLQYQEEQKRTLQLLRRSTEQLQMKLNLKDQQLAASQNEVRKLKDEKQEQQKQLDDNNVKIDQLQSDLQSKTQLLAASQNEVTKLMDEKKEQQKQLEDNHVKIDQLQSELQSKTQLLAASHDKMRMLRSEKQKQQKQFEGDCLKIDQLQSELQSKTQQLAASQNEVRKLKDEKQEKQKQLDGIRVKIDQLQSELQSKKQLLAVSQNELKALKNSRQEQEKLLERNRVKIDLHQFEQQSKTQQLAASQNEVRKLKEEQQEQQIHLDGNRVKIDQLQSELQTKTQLFAALQNEERKLKDQIQEQQKQLERSRVKIEQQQSELQSKTQQLASPTKPLTFSSRPRGTFKGPGLCRDVAVTPHGSLLVAAGADGLKEYDATSFREMATWKPNSDLLVQGERVWVITVDVLSDGSAVVGLNPKHVVLLRRSLVSGSSAAADWRVERRLAELQAPPRHLSAWDDLRLLVVLEDRWDQSQKNWYCGPGLVLLSLNDCDGSSKQQQEHSSSRLQLQYDACSVALTDRCVMVSSSDEVNLSDAVGSRKCYVVDCYSHRGLRLWRHEVGGGLNVMSVCTDSVGRVLYAAKGWSSVVALCIDDGRELSTAIKLSTKETERTYAVTLDRATQRLLALISRDANNLPNIITIFSVA